MSDLRITNIKTYLVPKIPYETNEYKWSSTKALLFVKVETNKGIDGWGECYTLADRERSTEMHVIEMARYFIDKDPEQIKYYNYWVYNFFGERRPGIDLYCAFSGIEIALWDIMGKYYNTPVYNLIGGKVRDRVPVYLNLGTGEPRTPEVEAEMTLNLAKKFGYKAVKLYPWDWMHDEDEIVEHIIKFRELIGNDFRLMIDVWREVDIPMIVRVAQKIEKCDVRWYEEPIAPDNYDKMAEIKNRTNLPIVGGESTFGKRSFNEMIKKNACDMINPDIAIVGGILEFKEIATLAEANYVKVGPHVCNSSTVATNATIHAAATIPNLDMVETFPWYFALGDKISNNQLKIKDGFIEVPNGPGLGIDINEDFFKSLKYEPRSMNSWEGKE